MMWAVPWLVAGFVGGLLAGWLGLAPLVHRHQMRRLEAALDAQPDPIYEVWQGDVRRYLGNDVHEAKEKRALHTGAELWKDGVNRG